MAGTTAWLTTNLTNNHIQLNGIQSDGLEPLGRPTATSGYAAVWHGYTTAILTELRYELGRIWLSVSRAIEISFWSAHTEQLLCIVCTDTSHNSHAQRRINCSISHGIHTSPQTRILYTEERDKLFTRVSTRQAKNGYGWLGAKDYILSHNLFIMYHYVLRPRNCSDRQRKSLRT